MDGSDYPDDGPNQVFGPFANIVDLGVSLDPTCIPKDASQDGSHRGPFLASVFTHGRLITIGTYIDKASAQAAIDHQMQFLMNAANTSVRAFLAKQKTDCILKEESNEVDDDVSTEAGSDSEESVMDGASGRARSESTARNTERNKNIKNDGGQSAQEPTIRSSAAAAPSASGASGASAPQRYRPYRTGQICEGVLAPPRDAIHALRALELRPTRFAPATFRLDLSAAPFASGQDELEAMCARAEADADRDRARKKEKAGKAAVHDTAETAEAPVAGADAPLSVEERLDLFSDRMAASGILEHLRSPAGLASHVAATLLATGSRTYDLSGPIFLPDLDYGVLAMAADVGGSASAVGSSNPPLERLIQARRRHLEQWDDVLRNRSPPSSPSCSPSSLAVPAASALAAPVPMRPLRPVCLDFAQARALAVCNLAYARAQDFDWRVHGGPWVMPDRDLAAVLSPAPARDAAAAGAANTEATVSPSAPSAPTAICTTAPAMSPRQRLRRLASLFSPESSCLSEFCAPRLEMQVRCRRYKAALADLCDFRRQQAAAARDGKVLDATAQAAQTKQEADLLWRVYMQGAISRPTVEAYACFPASFTSSGGSTGQQKSTAGVYQPTLLALERRNAIRSLLCVALAMFFPPNVSDDARPTIAKLPPTATARLVFRRDYQEQLGLLAAVIARRVRELSSRTSPEWTLRCQREFFSPASDNGLHRVGLLRDYLLFKVRTHPDVLARERAATPSVMPQITDPAAFAPLEEDQQRQQKPSAASLQLLDVTMDSAPQSNYASSDPLLEISSSSAEALVPMEAKETTVVSDESLMGLPSPVECVSAAPATQSFGLDDTAMTNISFAYMPVPGAAIKDTFASSQSGPCNPEVANAEKLPLKPDETRMDGAEAVITAPLALPMETMKKIPPSTQPIIHILRFHLDKHRFDDEDLARRLGISNGADLRDWLAGSTSNVDPKPMPAALWIQITERVTVFLQDLRNRNFVVNARADKGGAAYPTLPWYAPKPKWWDRFEIRDPAAQPKSADVNKHGFNSDDDDDDEWDVLVRKFATLRKALFPIFDRKLVTQQRRAKQALMRRREANIKKRKRDLQLMFQRRMREDRNVEAFQRVLNVPQRTGNEQRSGTLRGGKPQSQQQRQRDMQAAYLAAKEMHERQTGLMQAVLKTVGKGYVVDTSLQPVSVLPNDRCAIRRVLLGKSVPVAQDACIADRSMDVDAEAVQSVGDAISGEITRDRDDRVYADALLLRADAMEGDVLDLDGLDADAAPGWEMTRCSVCGIAREWDSGRVAEAWNVELEKRSLSHLMVDPMKPCNAQRLIPCSSCSCVVHSRCYGLDLSDAALMQEIEENTWRCDCCRISVVSKTMSAGVRFPEDIVPRTLAWQEQECALCRTPFGGLAMKPVTYWDVQTFQADAKQKQENGFAHVVCLLLAKFVRFPWGKRETLASPDITIPLALIRMQDNLIARRTEVMTQTKCSTIPLETGVATFSCLYCERPGYDVCEVRCMSQDVDAYVRQRVLDSIPLENRLHSASSLKLSPKCLVGCNFHLHPACALRCGRLSVAHYTFGHTCDVPGLPHSHEHCSDAGHGLTLRVKQVVRMEDPPVPPSTVALPPVRLAPDVCLDNCCGKWSVPSAVPPPRDHTVNASLLDLPLRFELDNEWGTLYDDSSAAEFASDKFGAEQKTWTLDLCKFFKAACGLAIPVADALVKNFLGKETCLAQPSGLDPSPKLRNPFEEPEVHPYFDIAMLSSSVSSVSWYDAQRQWHFSSKEKCIPSMPDETPATPSAALEQLQSWTSAKDVDLPQIIGKKLHKMLPQMFLYRGFCHQAHHAPSGRITFDFGRLRVGRGAGTCSLRAVPHWWYSLESTQQPFIDPSVDFPLILGYCKKQKPRPDNGSDQNVASIPNVDEASNQVDAPKEEIILEPVTVMMPWIGKADKKLGYSFMQRAQRVQSKRRSGDDLGLVGAKFVVRQFISGLLDDEIFSGAEQNDSLASSPFSAIRRAQAALQELLSKHFAVDDLMSSCRVFPSFFEQLVGWGHIFQMEQLGRKPNLGFAAVRMQQQPMAVAATTMPLPKPQQQIDGIAPAVLSERSATSGTGRAVRSSQVASLALPESKPQSKCTQPAEVSTNIPTVSAAGVLRTNPIRVPTSKTTTTARIRFDPGSSDEEMASDADKASKTKSSAVTKRTTQVDIANEKATKQKPAARSIEAGKKEPQPAPGPAKLSFTTTSGGKEPKTLAKLTGKCALSPKLSLGHLDCDTGPYAPGNLVWAKTDGSPWWPSIVVTPRVLAENGFSKAIVDSAVTQLRKLGVELGIARAKSDGSLPGRGGSAFKGALIYFLGGDWEFMTARPSCLKPYVRGPYGDEAHLAEKMKAPEYYRDAVRAAEWFRGTYKDCSDGLKEPQGLHNSGRLPVPVRSSWFESNAFDISVGSTVRVALESGDIRLAVVRALVNSASGESVTGLFGARKGDCADDFCFPLRAVLSLCDDKDSDSGNEPRSPKNASKSRGSASDTISITIARCGFWRIVPADKHLVEALPGLFSQLQSTQPVDKGPVNAENDRIPTASAVTAPINAPADQHAKNAGLDADVPSPCHSSADAAPSIADSCDRVASEVCLLPAAEALEVSVVEPPLPEPTTFASIANAEIDHSTDKTMLSQSAAETDSPKAGQKRARIDEPVEPSIVTVLAPPVLPTHTSPEFEHAPNQQTSSKKARMLSDSNSVDPKVDMLEHPSCSPAAAPAAAPVPAPDEPSNAPVRGVNRIAAVYAPPARRERTARGTGAAVEYFML